MKKSDRRLIKALSSVAVTAYKRAKGIKSGTRLTSRQRMALKRDVLAAYAGYKRQTKPRRRRA